MAAYLIYHGTPGWGWFLFCVLLFVGSASFKLD